MRIEFIDFEDTDKLMSAYDTLMENEQEYDLYCMPPAFVAYENETPVGIATFLLLPSDAMAPGTKEDSSSPKEAELNIYVAFPNRRKGIAKGLIDKITAYIKEHFEDTTTIVNLPPELESSSLAKHFAFAELLLEAEPDTKGFDDQKIGAGLTEPDDYGLPTGSIFEKETEKKDGEEVITYAIKKDGNEIARLYITPAGSYAFLSGLFTEPAFRRQGYGSALTQYALSDSLKEGTPVLLHVRSTNTPAVNLYRKIGFAEIDRLDYYDLSVL